jgi:hypothetical protein
VLLVPVAEPGEQACLAEVGSASVATAAGVLGLSARSVASSSPSSKSRPDERAGGAAMLT